MPLKSDWPKGILFQLKLFYFKTINKGIHNSNDRTKNLNKKLEKARRDQFDIDETTNDLTELSIDEPQIEGVIFEEEFEDLEEVEENLEEIANLIK
ncbi:hypothetical protein H5410_020991 [Solanum commersonii]|uniref:Uncharacterized protein n=1 Tax=Solanum commersonii TaxID=4109 RepID=A0A9J5ZFU8_SOLCO|nr:hypothetical protein H5410_020991 [Solanum commersonii]